MTEKQIETADKLLKLMKEHNDRLDKDQLSSFFLSDINNTLEETKQWIALNDVISILEGKKAVEWLPGDYVVKLKDGASLILKFVKLNSKLEKILDNAPHHRIEFPHSDVDTKRFVDDGFISFFSDYTSDRSFYNVDKLKIEQFLGNGGYPIKPSVHQVIDRSQHITVGRDLSGNVVQSSDLPESPLLIGNKISSTKYTVAESKEPMLSPLIKWIAGIIAGVIIGYILYSMGWI